MSYSSKNKNPMKKLWLFLPLALLLVACEPTEDVTESDDQLIEALLLADEQEEATLAMLPPESLEEIETRFFDTYVETIVRVPGRGFIVELGNGETAFFTEQGRMLRFRRPFVAGGLFPHHPHGRCYRVARRFGDPLPLDQLAASITEYIATNYPDAVIRRAKEVDNGNIFVLISGPRVLRFDASGEFAGEVDVLAHCDRICRPLGEDTPAGAAVIDYVTTNFPDIEGRRVCRGPNRIVVMLRTDDGRIILIFDGDGNFLHQRP
jgi:hypothetical protein